MTIKYYMYMHIYIIIHDIVHVCTSKCLASKCTKFGEMLTAFIWHYWRCKFTQKSCQIFSGDNYYMYSTLSVVLYVCTYDAMVQEVHVHAEIVSSEPFSVPLPWFIWPESFGDSALKEAAHNYLYTVHQTDRNTCTCMTTLHVCIFNHNLH